MRRINVTVICGPPAAGKSCIADRILRGMRASGTTCTYLAMDAVLGLTLVSGTPYYRDYAGITRRWDIDRADERTLTAAAEQMRYLVHHALFVADNILVEGLFHRPEDRRSLLYYLDGPSNRDLQCIWATPRAQTQEQMIETLRERNSVRAIRTPESLISDVVREMLPPTEDEGWTSIKLEGV